MPEDEPFIRALLAAPDDQTVRLVYADWLDDRGDPRANYLRLQARAAELPPISRERARMQEMQTRLPSWWLAVVGFHATPQEPDRARITEAAGILGHPVKREENGYAVTIEGAAVSGLTGAVAYLESWIRGNEIRTYEGVYHFRINNRAGREVSWEPHTFHREFDACKPQFLEWYGDQALMIYRENYQAYACRLSFYEPSAFRELTHGCGRWVLDGRELSFRRDFGRLVSRLSVPDLTELTPLTEAEARQRDLLPPNR